MATRSWRARLSAGLPLSAAENLAGFVAAALMFAAGIGRYRFVLVYAAFRLFNAIGSLCGTRIRGALLPATLVALYFDVSRGPVMPVFARNSLVLGVLVVIAAEIAVRNYTQRKCTRLSKGKWFAVCPACRYDNGDLVKKCGHCSHEKGQSHYHHSDCRGTALSGLPGEVVSMLGLDERDEVIFQMRLFPHRSVLKNQKRQIRNYFVVTTSGVVLLDCSRVTGGWRERDVIPIADIVSVEGGLGKVTRTPEPVLRLSTSTNDRYEVVFKKFGRYGETIAEIGRLIQEKNPGATVTLDMETGR